MKALLQKYKELILYMVFGCGTTLVNYLIYTLFVFLLKGTMNETVYLTISNAVAWIGGVIFAYVTNKIWVFESKSWKGTVVLREALEFVAARGFTGIFEIFGVPLLVKIGLNQTVFGIEGMVAKLLVSVVVIILNYVFSKLIIFKKDKNPEAEKAE